MKNIFHKFSGFILIEMIMAIVLLGVIGIFTSMFLYTGIKGYLIAKQTSDGAMRAQIALDRINLELRKITDLPGPAPNPEPDQITYTTDDLPGTRKIVYDSNANTISIEVTIGFDTDTYLLLDRVETFNLTWEEANLDDSPDASLEIAGINVELTLEDVGRPFNMRIYPRNWLRVLP
jgi:type II secretory pathway pseudopilin PulG